MARDDLESTLETAESRLGWVERLGRYFEAHELCYGHGTDNAVDEAFWLVWHLSGTPADLDELAPDPALIPRIVELAHRRVRERMPLAYLLRSAWFAGLEFEVGPAVLVPRSPLAELIESGFAPWRRLEAGDRILEIGTGSGCMAIATAVHQAGVTVEATDIDPAALAIARANARRHGVGERVRFIEADLFPSGATRYSVIMANPPYVPTSDVMALPAEYRHEPVTGLDGGTDGLDAVRRILAGAGARLADGGALIVEVGQSAETLVGAYPHVPWTWLTFERGGEGVFLLTADELNDGWG